MRRSFQYPGADLHSDVRDARSVFAHKFLTPTARAAASGERLWMGVPAVIGIGIGLGAEAAERQVEDHSLVAYVTAESVARDLPPKFQGYPVRGEIVGAVRAAAQAGVGRTARGTLLPLARTVPSRPTIAGVSVGHGRATAGTLGCLVRNQNGDCFVLSNNHVLACCNEGQAGDPILQPGPADGGQDPLDRLASLSRSIPIDFIGNGQAVPNLVDAAMALVSGEPIPSVYPFIFRIGQIEGPRDPAADPFGLRLRKTGRTTHLTQGIIEAVDVDVIVDYSDSGKGFARFEHQIVVAPVNGDSEEGARFASSGDSGSIVVDEHHRAIGLLFAVSTEGSGRAWLNPIEFVLDALDVEICTICCS